MTEKQFIEIKAEYFENIKKMLLELGNIQPTVTVIGNHIEENKPAIVHIPLPAELANSDNGKQMFVDKMIPDISKKIHEKFTIDAVCFASEAWLRTADKDGYNPETDNYKKLPISKEILIISIDGKDGSKSDIYEIKRDGKSINTDGDLIDTIELEPLPELGETYNTNTGRFSNLYKKFSKQ
jgi:hypothetical protein